MIYLELFLTFFKIGLFTFGGGYAMLPFIQKEVALHNWLTEAEVINFVAVSESTPGPFAINMSTYVGIETGGILGAICATLGATMPSFIVILLVAKFYEKFKNSKVVSGCMTGLKPAAIGLIGTAVLTIGKTVFFPTAVSLAAIMTFGFISSLVIFALMFVLVMKKTHPIIIIALSAVLGIAAGFIGEVI